MKMRKRILYPVFCLLKTHMMPEEANGLIIRRAMHFYALSIFTDYEHVKDMLPSEMAKNVAKTWAEFELLSENNAVEASYGSDFKRTEKEQF